MTAKDSRKPPPSGSSPEAWERWVNEAMGQKGSWTPDLGGSAGNGTHDYSVQMGLYSYSPITKRVDADFSITITTKDSSGTTSGNLRITGLPLTIKSTSNYRPVCYLVYGALDLNVAGGYYQAVGFGQSGTTRIDLLEVGDNVAAANLTAADFANGTLIRGSISYEAD